MKLTQAPVTQAEPDESSAFHCPCGRGPALIEGEGNGERAEDDANYGEGLDHQAHAFMPAAP